MLTLIGIWEFVIRNHLDKLCSKWFVVTTVLSGVMTIVKQYVGMSSENVEENVFYC